VQVGGGGQLLLLPSLHRVTNKGKREGGRREGAKTQVGRGGGGGKGAIVQKGLGGAKHAPRTTKGENKNFKKSYYHKYANFAEGSQPTPLAARESSCF